MNTNNNYAPEKLYLIYDVDETILSYDPSTKLQGCRYDFVDKEVFPIEEGTDIEYTRTNAFIEKANEWVKDRVETFIVDTPICPYFDYKRAIEDFKKYMEGE